MSPDEPAVKLYAIYLCDPCVKGVGGECHTPGCSMFLNRAPDLPLRPPMTVPIQEFRCGQVEAEKDRPLTQPICNNCGARQHAAATHPEEFFSKIKRDLHMCQSCVSKLAEPPITQEKLDTLIEATEGYPHGETDHDRDK